MGIFDKLNSPVFLKEESDATTYIERLIALQEKAQGELKDEIDKEIKIAKIGEFGENNIAFELKNSAMPMYILHDIHLEVDGLSAQIDYIVVTRKVNFVIECKNLIGNIDIDSNGNFIRNYELYKRKVKEGIYSPITQNQRHMEILKQIRSNSKGNIITKTIFEKYFDTNYKSVVVLANPKTVLNAKFAKKEIKEKVIRADQLIKYIKDMNAASKVTSYSDKDMKAFAEELLQYHTPNKSDYAKKYEDILEKMNNENLTVNVKPDVIISNKVDHKNNNFDEEVKESDQLYETNATPKQYIKNNAYNEHQKYLNNYKPQQQKMNQPAQKQTITNQEQPQSVINQEELISKLKAYRLQKSRQEKIKPYYVFNDAQMMDLISKMPNTKEGILAITGFGNAKVEKYGEEILAIFKNA